MARKDTHTKKKHRDTDTNDNNINRKQQQWFSKIDNEGRKMSRVKKNASNDLLNGFQLYAIRIPSQTSIATRVRQDRKKRDANQPANNCEINKNQKAISTM